MAGADDGQALGTPGYAAPEMAKRGEAEPRSGLYSLGATFFHALAGRPAFESRSFSEIIIKQATQAPPENGGEPFGDASPVAPAPQ
jgi:serine/threonine protein kinase